MPPPAPVVLVPWSPEWAGIAAGLTDQLQVLGTNLAIVHHIGSTSVPGLAAKPIIDLMPLVVDFAELDCQRVIVEGLGYQWYGEYGIPGRRFCTLSTADGTRVTNVHFFEQHSPEVARHLAFRDYLRAHPQAARDYEMEKRRARELHPFDTNAYTDEKNAWIRATEAQALAWRAEQDSRLDN